MHPKALVAACTELVKLTLALAHPADAVVARYFREHHAFGPRERTTLAATAYRVLRNKLLFEQFARSGSGPLERRLAILGFDAPRALLESVLTPDEKIWLAQCDAIDVSSLPAAQRYSLPEWLLAPLQKQLGETGCHALAQCFLQGAPLDLRVNTLQAKRPAMQAELAQAGIETSRTTYCPWGLRAQGKPALGQLHAFQRGAIEVQDEGAQLLALLLGAKRGEMVVDFCAGAGGKTLALGAAMRNTGRLYALDVSPHRLEALKQRLARSGLGNVHTLALSHEDDARLQRLAAKADRVLVDAPCSGTGTLRRNPDLKWRQSPRTVQDFAALQVRILKSAAKLLKPGGRLVYATCSLLPEENESVALAFGAEHPDFAPQDTATLLTQLQVPQAQSLCHAGTLRLWPHLHHTDGFFAAVWARKA